MVIDLIAEVVVNLVSVVLPRIVTGSNDDTAVKLEMAHSKGNHRHRSRLAKDKSIYPVVGKHLRYRSRIFL